MNPLLKRLAIVPIIATIIISRLVIADGSDDSVTDGSLHTLTFVPDESKIPGVSWSVLHGNSIELPLRMRTFYSLTVNSYTVLYIWREKLSDNFKTSVPTIAEVGKNS